MQLKNVQQENFQITLQQEEFPITCIHCNMKINSIKLKGISIVCPVCNKPSDILFNENTFQD